MANFKTVNVELTERECLVISLAVDSLLHLINDEEILINNDCVDTLRNELVDLRADGFTLYDEPNEQD